MTNLLDRALNNNALRETDEFHIVWCPGGRNNSRYSFETYEEAVELCDMLKERFGREDVFVMSHVPKVLT